MSSPPPVSSILETAIYAEDLAVLSRWYRDVFGFTPLVDTPRLCALDVSGKSVLLLFQRGATKSGLGIEGGFVPPHDGSGPSHFAFAISADDIGRWENHLDAHGIAIESRVEWPRGGVSLYFRDPENHSVELVTERTWATY